MVKLGLCRFMNGYDIALIGRAVDSFKLYGMGVSFILRVISVLKLTTWLLINLYYSNNGRF